MKENRFALIWKTGWPPHGLAADLSGLWERNGKWTDCEYQAERPDFGS